MKKYLMKRFIIRKIPIVIALAALGILLFSGLVMVLWNGILPAVLHVSAITIWQAAGILLLSKILFGGRRRMGHGHWKKKMYMKWHAMTPDERGNMKYAYCHHGWQKGRVSETEEQTAS